MLNHLKRSIGRDAAKIDSFVNEGLDTLTDRPRTHEQIVASSKKYEDFRAKRRQLAPLYDRLEAKNKLLRSFGTPGGHDQFIQLQLKFDKFESTMDSHIQMIEEQTDVLKRNLKSRYENFLSESDKLLTRWKQNRPRESEMEDEEKCREALKLVRDKDKEVRGMVEQKEKIM